MTDNLMSTAPGGESDQYSSIKTVTQPPSTSKGQLGGSAAGSSENVDPNAQDERRERGEKTAENIRYGQAISEQGMGGQTSTSTGSAGHEGGYGGTADESGVGPQAGGDGETRERAKQGLGGKNESSGEVGA